MFEKLVLAATITFSLNLCLHVRDTGKPSVEVQPSNQADTPPTILVRLPRNQREFRFTHED
ncbi:hypothetical protein [Calothrix sp. NIES-3974]|uniref:hypothetical protein n=1 Tax=Calothrix sp. NIES-3974 TaxID=2005462 RepID=UPI000B61DDB1|nr:hypothetical protein [Calothrix sp. NIES-3974]BAZ04401.1 hypothetical protein NIES3974_10390 [Calothrix sp. NIES-3974]